jgi:hypothetical protein
VRIIGITSGWVTLKKPFSETSMTLRHCASRRAGKGGVVVDAGVVDHDLDRARGQQPFAGGLRRGPIGHVEGDRLGAAAIGDDPRRDRLGGLEPGVGMNDDMGAVARQALGDRLADAAAGAGDEGAAAEGRLLVHPATASSTTARRPAAISRPSCATTNA